MYKRAVFAINTNFKDLGAEVIGISSDTVESHRNLLNSTNYLSFYWIDKKIRRALVFHQECSGCFGRVTYVVDKEGKIIMILTVCWLRSTFQKRWKRLKN
jgi:peroxiredoxin Q/BCP